VRGHRCSAAAIEGTSGPGPECGSLHLRYTASALDSTCCGKAKGGYWWDAAHSYKACASNAGTSLAFCRLYLVSNDTRWLNSSMEAFNFWQLNFVAPSGQVCDGVHANDGNLRWDVYSYNQGMMLGAAACLFQVSFYSL